MESRAVAAALDFVTRQGASSTHVTSKAHAQDSGDEWVIFIPRVAAEREIVFPADGVVHVKKGNCTARWGLMR